VSSSHSDEVSNQLRVCHLAQLRPKFSLGTRLPNTRIRTVCSNSSSREPRRSAPCSVVGGGLYVRLARGVKPLFRDPCGILEATLADRWQAVPGKEQRGRRLPAIRPINAPAAMSAGRGHGRHRMTPDHRKSTPVPYLYIGGHAERPNDPLTFPLYIWVRRRWLGGGWMRGRPCLRRPGIGSRRPAQLRLPVSMKRRSP
jgi:hypothetical protein